MKGYEKNIGKTLLNFVNTSLHLQNVQKTELTSCNTVAKDTFQSRCSSVDEQKCV